MSMHVNEHANKNFNKVSMVMSLKLSMLITNDDDHDGHDDNVFLAGWGSFEASNFS